MQAELGIQQAFAAVRSKDKILRLFVSNDSSFGHTPLLVHRPKKNITRALKKQTLCPHSIPALSTDIQSLLTHNLISTRHAAVVQINLLFICSQTVCGSIYTNGHVLYQLTNPSNTCCVCVCVCAVCNARHCLLSNLTTSTFNHLLDDC